MPMSRMTVTVECLGCGCVRGVIDDGHILATGACPRCGYVGWAHVAELTESDRRDLRDVPVPFRPVESRSTGVVWR
ncbi:MAG: hypothetical protein U0R69_16785 [Gaiellales bacterium]